MNDLCFASSEHFYSEGWVCSLEQGRLRRSGGETAGCSQRDALWPLAFGPRRQDSEIVWVKKLN